MRARILPAEFYEWQGEDLILRVRVQPRASRDELAEPYGDRIKIRITSPPVEGKANDHLIRFLAKQFGVPGNRITLLAGAASRDKRLKIEAPARLPKGIRH